MYATLIENVKLRIRPVCNKVERQRIARCRDGAQARTGWRKSMQSRNSRACDLRNAECSSASGCADTLGLKVHEHTQAYPVATNSACVLSRARKGRRHLQATNCDRAFALELLPVAILLLLLTVFQAAAVVRLQHAVSAAEVALTEAAVADNTLGGILALLKIAANLFRASTSAQRQGEMQRGSGTDIVCVQTGRQFGQVTTGMHEAQIRFGQVCAQYQERTQRRDGCGRWHRDGKCWEEPWS